MKLEGEVKMRRLLLCAVLLLWVTPLFAQEKFAGDFQTNTVVPYKFMTFKTDGTLGTLVGGAIAVYKQADLTQVTYGATLTADFDGITGINQVSIDTSSNAWYTADTGYQVLLTAGTVDSVSVAGYVVMNFTLHSGQMSIPKNVAITGFPVFMRTTGTANTGKTGITPACRASLNTGSGFAASSATGITVIGAIEASNFPGWYALDFTAAVTNADRILLECTGTGADPYYQFVVTQR